MCPELLIAQSSGAMPSLNAVHFGPDSFLSVLDLDQGLCLLVFSWACGAASLGGLEREVVGSPGQKPSPGRQGANGSFSRSGSAHCPAVPVPVSTSQLDPLHCGPSCPSLLPV